MDMEDNTKRNIQ